jgi:hypothetical protein
MTKHEADCIVEVSIHYFKKGDKVFFKNIEHLCHLGGDSVEDATDEIPETERTTKRLAWHNTIIDTYPDSVFNQDWTGFEFSLVGEGTKNWRCGVDYYIDNFGDEETFTPFRDDLLKLAQTVPPSKRNFVRVLAAFNYWSYRDGNWGDEYEDGIKLVGRLDMCNINIITP